MKTLHVGKKHLQLALVTLAMGSAMVQPSEASIGTITKADLSGAWRISMTGRTGCGDVAMMADVSLNTLGVGTATLKTHGDCGDSTQTGLPFTVSVVDANGTGKANLSCGVGCGWELEIQVSPDRSSFSVIDVNPINPGNYISGIAIHK